MLLVCLTCAQAFGLILSATMLIGCKLYHFTRFVQVVFWVGSKGAIKFVRVLDP
jgi:hypothetical protein